MDVLSAPVSTLVGKTALVTGGYSGIGLATAQRLAALGARVAIVGRDHARCVAAAEPLGGVGFGADVRESAQVTASFEAAHAALGALDLVVLSAGIARGGKVGEVTDDVYREMVATNVDGIFYGVRTAARLMGDRGGAVVAIASLGGVVPIPTDPVYSLTKSAVVGFVRSLPRTSVRVCSVCPGMVDTPLLSAATRRYLKAVRYPFIPVEDVARLIVDVAVSDRHGETWVIQPGIPPWNEAAPDAPGPRVDTWRPRASVAPSQPPSASAAPSSPPSAGVAEAPSAGQGSSTTIVST